MPVVAVKLNDKTECRHKGVNTELATDEMLPFIGETEAVKDCISGSLDVVGVKTLLCCVHTDEHGPTFGISITARNRAVGDVVRLLSGRRPTKRLLTHLTGVCRFVSSLPFVRVISRAKVMILPEASGWDVDGNPADSTRELRSGFALRAVRLTIAVERAIPLIRFHVGGDDLPATDTSDRPNFVSKCSLHGLIIPQNRQQSNRLELCNGS